MTTELFIHVYFLYAKLYLIAEGGERTDQVSVRVCVLFFEICFQKCYVVLRGLTNYPFPGVSRFSINEEACYPRG